MKINTKKLYKIEDELINELADNGTEKAQKLFSEWQTERIRLNELQVKNLDKLLKKLQNEHTSKKTS